MAEHTPAGNGSARGPRAKRVLVAVFLLTVVAAPLAATASLRGHSAAAPQELRAAGRVRAIQGGGGSQTEKPQAGVAHAASLPKPVKVAKPKVLYLQKARSAVFDVRKLKSTVIKRERPEAGDRDGGADADQATDPDRAAADPDQATADPDQAAAADPDATTATATETAATASTPTPDTSFDGLDFLNWGQGHPPDENGDVGPSYYIQTVNVAIGIYDKSSGNQVAAFTFNSFMSQGHFGNLCDTDNFGDPVVLYDSYEDRWVITDFAFKLDAGGNVNPQTVYECFAVSKTGDPVNGGWNFYSILSPGGLADYPKFGVWPDGIYMSANMFGYASSGGYQGYHVWALDKQQMYAGAPTVQVVDFSGDTSDFTVIPANSKLQAGAPPAGSPEYFVSTEQFLNALSIYKFHVDWDKVSTSSFTGPFTQSAPNCWPNSAVSNASTPANSLDTLSIRAMAQAQYTNQGGAESLWVDHTVNRGTFTLATCGGTNSNNATLRWYQANVTGGTVAANVVQGATYDPEGANTFFRFMPALAVDRTGDMAVVYSKANATTNPQIEYAGRLASDPANTLGQGEQTLIDGTGSQSGNCGGAPCTRWGDYSGMALDPNGCEFWMTEEYYATTGLNDLTRIGSFHYPSCTTVGNGTLSGTVTAGGNPAAGATVTLGTRTTTTDGSGHYSFTVPAGTYPSVTAAKAGFDAASASSLVVPDGGTLTQNLSLTAAAQSGCFTDNTQTAFQRGVPSNCDLVASPGAVVLAKPDNTDAMNNSVSPTGFGISATSWAGQTFTPTVTGQLKRVDVELFCASCTANSPNITVSVRATTGTTPVPTGADLATATIPGFNDGAAGGLKTAVFASPVTLTAGTRYAFVFRLASTFSAGTVAYTCSCQTTGFSNTNPYANGQRVTSSTSGSSWTADTTVGGRDLNFVTYINPGYSASGTLVSSLKDANPAAGSAPKWTTLSFSDSTPAGTNVQFQVAGSNSPYGPFTYVGPDGTASTFFTTSGASLSQFDGFRYLRYKAYLTTTDPSVTPSLSSVQACFQDVSQTSATSLAAGAATGTFGGTTTLTATLTSSGNPVGGKSVSFTLNGSSAGSATTNASGVATVSNVSLSGINAGSYPTGVSASFAGDGSFDPSSGSNSLTVAKADQAITVTTPAPASAVFNTGFGVAATGGNSGEPVTFSSAGSCSNTGAGFTMTSGTGTCSVKFDQAGNGNYNPAPEVTESVTAQKADQTITVTTPAPSSAVYATSFGVAATAATGLVSFSSAGGCVNFGDNFTMTSGTDSCSVRFDQIGDDNYNPAPQVTETVTAQKAGQTITVTTSAPASAVYGGSFGVAATADSGNAVTFSSGGSCSSSGSTFTMTSGTGTCSVKYDQAGDDNYNPATQVVESTRATKASLKIKATGRTKAQGSTLDLGTTAFSTSGLVGSDAVASVTLTSAGADASAAPGTYPIVPSAAVAASGTDFGNYSLHYGNGTLTVTTNTGPTVKIGTPKEGAIYKQDSVVDASYQCVAAHGVPVASCVGTVSNGSPLDTSTVGQHSFAVTGTDVNGGPATLTRHYMVIYNWSGFYSLANEAKQRLNVVHAGDLIAATFSLRGDRELDVLADGSPDSVAVSCPSWLTTNIRRAAAGTATGLSYSSATGRYTYDWQTDAAWAGTCRRFRLATADGTAPHTAIFQFTS